MWVCDTWAFTIARVHVWKVPFLCLAISVTFVLLVAVLFHSQQKRQSRFESVRCSPAVTRSNPRWRPLRPLDTQTVCPPYPTQSTSQAQPIRNAGKQMEWDWRVFLLGPPLIHFILFMFLTQCIWNDMVNVCVTVLVNFWFCFLFLLCLNYEIWTSIVLVARKNLLYFTDGSLYQLFMQKTTTKSAKNEW